MKTILLFLFVIVGCGLSIHAQSVAGDWKLDFIVIEVDMAYSIMEPITLKIDENGLITGSGGCNTYSGRSKYKQPRKAFKKPVAIKFTDIVATKIACPKTTRTEDVYFRSLREAATVYIKNGELLIDSPKNGHSMTFKKDVTAKP